MYTFQTGPAPLFATRPCTRKTVRKVTKKARLPTQGLRESLCTLRCDVASTTHATLTRARVLTDVYSLINQAPGHGLPDHFLSFTACLSPSRVTRGRQIPHPDPQHRSLPPAPRVAGRRRSPLLVTRRYAINAGASSVRHSTEKSAQYRTWGCAKL